MHVTNGKLGNLQLPGAGLTTTELASVRKGLFDAASQSSERDKNELEKFDGFLRDHPWRFTAVVDGPNVAYLNQNYDGGRFRPLQIKAVVDVLEARGNHWRGMDPALWREWDPALWRDLSTWWRCCCKVHMIAKRDSDVPTVCQASPRGVATKAIVEAGLRFNRAQGGNRRGACRFINC